MAQPRHGYANATYAAERRAAQRTWRNGEPLLPLTEARAFIAEVVEWCGFTVPPKVSFYEGHRGAGWAYVESREIRLSRRGLTRSLVLHEIAHLLAGQNDRGHGKVFRAHYLALAHHFLPRYSKSLNAAFRYYEIEVLPHD